MLRQWDTEVFEALKRESVPSRGDTEDDQLTQILVDIQEGNIESSEDENSEKESEDDSRGIDLMASNDEEETETESEEDRAFMDDGPSDENNPCFYQRLNVEVDKERRQQLRQTRDQLEELQDIVGGSADVSDDKVLKAVEEKLNAYINELPELGFNLGKYDINIAKRFLSPYLVNTSPYQVLYEEKQQSHASQDQVPQVSGYHQLSSTWIQLWPVPESLRMQTDQRVLSLRVGRRVG